MPTLANSTRRAYKATYAPLKIDTNSEKDKEAQKKVTRGMDKMSYIQSLDIHEAELPKIRDRINTPAIKPAEKKSLMSIFDMTESLVKDAALGSAIKYVTGFAEFDVDVLIRFGHLVADHRDEVDNELQSNFEEIKLKYAENEEVMKKSSSLENKSDSSEGPESLVANFAGHLVHYSKTQTPLKEQKNSSTKKTETGLKAATQVQANFEKIATPATAVTNPEMTKITSDTVEGILLWAGTHQPKLMQKIVNSELVLAQKDITDIMTPEPRKVAYAMKRAKKKRGRNTRKTVTGFEERMKIEPVGRLHLERLEMTPVGVQRGELAHSVPLTPKESVNISHREWSVRTEEFDSIVNDFFEGYSEEGVAEKNDVAQATESQSKHSTALNVGASLSASYASVTLSTSMGYNSTSDDQVAQKDSRNHSVSITRKASARTRKDHKTSFKVSSMSGSEDSAVRVITNPSETDAMRVDYYQLMRKWKVNLYRYGLRMTYDITIPNPGGDLAKKIYEIDALEKKINEPFTFNLPVSAIDYNSWQRYATMYNATVEAPPEKNKTISAYKMIDLNGDEDQAENYK